MVKNTKKKITTTKNLVDLSLMISVFYHFFLWISKHLWKLHNKYVIICAQCLVPTVHCSDCVNYVQNNQLCLVFSSLIIFIVRAYFLLTFSQAIFNNNVSISFCYDKAIYFEMKTFNCLTFTTEITNMSKFFHSYSLKFRYDTRIDRNLIFFYKLGYWRIHVRKHQKPTKKTRFIHTKNSQRLNIAWIQDFFNVNDIVTKLDTKNRTRLA